MPKPDAGPTPVTDTEVDYVMRYAGRCRDCADENGVCPATGLSCDVTAARQVIRWVLGAERYGKHHGYLPADASNMPIRFSPMTTRFRRPH